MPTISTNREESSQGKSKPFILREFLLNLSSGSKKLLKITSKLRMILQNISRKVVLRILMNIIPSNIFPNFAFG